MKQERKSHYVNMIHDHIIRVQSQRENEKDKVKTLTEKKGVRARSKRLIKTIGQGVIEAASRASFMTPIFSPYG